MSEDKIFVTVQLDREMLDIILQAERKTLERIYDNPQNREHALKNMSNESAVNKAVYTYCELVKSGVL